MSYAICDDCGQAHDPDIRCPNYHAGMLRAGKPAMTDTSLGEKLPTEAMIEAGAEALRNRPSDIYDEVATAACVLEAAMSRASHKTDEGVVEAAKNGLRPLVNDLGDEGMNDAWLTDLATAAINAAYPLLVAENMRLREAATNARFALEFYEREIAAMIRFGNISKHALERCRERGQEEITRIAALTRDSGIDIMGDFGALSGSHPSGHARCAVDGASRIDPGERE